MTIALPAAMSPDDVTSFPDAESMLPAAARCDIAIDGFDAIESQVSTVTEVEVPSLTLTVSIDPNAIDPLSARVIPLAIVVIEFRCCDESVIAWSRKNGVTAPVALKAGKERRCLEEDAQGLEDWEDDDRGCMIASSYVGRRAGRMEDGAKSMCGIKASRSWSLRCWVE